MTKIKIENDVWVSDGNKNTNSTMYTLGKAIFVELRATTYNDNPAANGFKVFATGGKFVETSDYNEACKGLALARNQSLGWRG